jgi:hypothetical protein
MAYYPYTLGKTFGSDEYQAGGTEGVDDYEVDPQMIRNSDLTYMGRNDAGNRIWEDEQGHQYVAGQLAKRNPDGTPKRSGGAYNATGNSSSNYGYDPGFTGSNAAQAQLDRLNAMLPSRSPVLSSRSVTAKDPLSRMTLPHAPLMDFGDYDDIPQTAGIGKFSKQNIKKTALSLPCVAQARAQGKNVTLDMDYSVNGKKVRDTMLIPPVPGSARAAGDLTPDGPAVRFFGSLNSDGSQAQDSGQVLPPVAAAHRARRNKRITTATATTRTAMVVAGAAVVVAPVVQAELPAVALVAPAAVAADQVLICRVVGKHQVKLRTMRHPMMMHPVVARVPVTALPIAVL